MNKQTVAVLRSSFAEIARRRPDVAALFYKRLFEVAPSVKPLFSSSPKEQQRKLVASLAQIVATVDQPEKLTEYVSRLGERHVSYGAEPAHYKVVGDVLLWTFEQVLQQNFTLPVRAAWTEAYTVVAKMMIAAGKQASKQVSAKAGAVTRKPVARRASSAAADSGKRKAAKRPARKATGSSKKRAR